MAGVVGYVEADDFFPFALLLLHIREFDAGVFYAVVCLDGLLAAIFQLGGRGTVAVGNGEGDDVTGLPSGDAEAAGTQEDVHHVVDTLGRRVGARGDVAAGV